MLSVKLKMQHAMKGQNGAWNLTSVVIFHAKIYIMEDDLVSTFPFD